MLTVLRVLSAWIWRIDPDVKDVNQLRLLAPDLPADFPADELACEVARSWSKRKHGPVHRMGTSCASSFVRMSEVSAAHEVGQWLLGKTAEL